MALNQKDALLTLYRKDFANFQGIYWQVVGILTREVLKAVKIQ